MATQYANGKIVTDGLSLCLNAADKNSYPGSGTTWTDLSGNGRNASLVNSPTFSSAGNGSISTDATNTYVSVGNVLDYTSESFTFSTWVLANTFTTNKVDGNQFNPVLFSKGGFNSRGYYCHFAGTYTSFITNQSGTNQITSATMTINTNTWYKLDITRNGSSVLIYMNGINATTSAASHTNPVSNSYPLTIGFYGDGYNLYGSYKIANFSSYNRVLSATEILQNYNAQKSRFNL
jgi:hypothetical protein